MISLVACCVSGMAGDWMEKQLTVSEAVYVDAQRSNERCQI